MSSQGACHLAAIRAQPVPEILPAMSTTSLVNLLPAAARLAPETPEDVAFAFAEARRMNRKLVVFSTGHGIPPIGDTTDRILLDMSAFDGVEVDPVTRVARIGICAAIASRTI